MLREITVQDLFEANNIAPFCRAQRINVAAIEVRDFPEVQEEARRHIESALQENGLAAGETMDRVKASVAAVFPDLTKERKDVLSYLLVAKVMDIDLSRGTEEKGRGVA